MLLLKYIKRQKERKYSNEKKKQLHSHRLMNGNAPDVITESAYCLLCSHSQFMLNVEDTKVKALVN